MRRLVLLILLLAASAALGLTLRDQLEHPVEQVAAAAPGPATPLPEVTLPELPRIEAPSLERYAAALDRPLFRQDRRPPTAETVEALAEEEPFAATLQGVILSGDERVALIRPSGATNVQQIAEGETFRGWRLREIGTERVVFERDGEERTLDLVYKASGTAGDPARREGR